MTGIPAGRLAGYDERFLLCRVNGHPWPDPQDWHWVELVTRRGRVLGYRVELTCTRCGKVRADRIEASSSWDKRTSYPVSPAGYRVEGDPVRRGEARMELLRRAAGTGRPGTVQREIVED